MEHAAEAAAVVAILLALVHAVAHLFSGALSVVPRNRWLSAGGGVSVAYVFVHLLPEIAEIQRELAERVGTLPFLERHAYLLALAGLATFYGLELAARRSEVASAGRTSHDAVGLIHFVSYGTYNAIVGYLLIDRAEQSLSTLALFALAMGVHFVVNDQGLRERHGRLYDRTGRWLVAAGVLVGWLLSLVGPIDEVTVELALAFLAGSVVLNVLKEELPEERQSRFWAFAVGAVVYAVLLLAL